MPLTLKYTEFDLAPSDGASFTPPKFESAAATLRFFDALARPTGRRSTDGDLDARASRLFDVQHAARRLRATAPSESSAQRATRTELLKRVIAVDVLECPHCGRRRKLIASRAAVRRAQSAALPCTSAGALPGRTAVLPGSRSAPNQAENRPTPPTSATARLPCGCRHAIGIPIPSVVGRDVLARR